MAAVGESVFLYVWHVCIDDGNGIESLAFVERLDFQDGRLLGD